MPEMDGCTATRKIRSQTGSLDVPYIIALTASAMREDVDACYAAGMNDILTKPIRIQDVHDALSDFLDKFRPERKLNSA